MWLLHEGFRLGDEAAVDADRPISALADYTYGVHRSTTMLRYLDRGRRVLAVDDAHPAVTGTRPLPSAFRAAFANISGLTTDEWMRAVSALVIRYFVWVADGRPHLATLDELMEFELPVRLSSRFRALAEAELVTGIERLGHAVLGETARAGHVCEGLGSTPQHDSRSMRDRPLLAVADGYLTPMGFGVLLERAVDLPRYLVEQRGSLARDRILRGLLGRQFEAYVTDRIAVLRGRHQVLDEQQITAVLGYNTRRGDALIGYNGDYLLLEISAQGLNRGVAAGEPADIKRKCGQYHEEADQAEAMATRLGELVRCYDLPTVRSWTYLVVTDQALPTSPALAAALRRSRPRRNPRFVCDIEEFELLLDLGVRGWSIPGAVATWQANPLEQSLGGHLHQWSLAVTPLENRDTARFSHDWFDELPTDGPQVA